MIINFTMVHKKHENSFKTMALEDYRRNWYNNATAKMFKIDFIDIDH